MRLTLLCVVVLVLASPSAWATELVDTTVLRLLARPELYDGRAVRVIGYCWLEFEGDALYLHEDDFLHGVMADAIWLSLSREQNGAYRPASGGYAIVEGIFRASSHGHLSAFGGTLENITRLQPWEGREPAPPFRFPVLVSAVAPPFPPDLCVSSALAFDLSVDAQGRVVDARDVAGFSERVPELLRRSDDMRALVKRWRYTPRGTMPPISVRVALLFSVAEATATDEELLPVFEQDSVAVKRRPCVPAHEVGAVP